MALTTAGRNTIADLIIGGGTAFDASNAYLGVGDDNTAFSAAQTDLVAASNKVRVIVDSTPTNTTNVLEFVATFTSAVGNFAWAEWGLFNHVSAGTMLTRKVADQGTKVSGQVWTFTAQITVGIGS